ncbi:MAG: SDR family oxidoreductase [Halioglobus sp.]|nr:SDR family oxidoreductase [Halioglobus sp.]
MSGHKTTALVTGASAGLGAEFCRQLADRCEVIIAVARRRAPLEALAAELGSQVEMHCIESDLTSVQGVARAMEALRQLGPVDYLVNNAGFSTFGSFAAVPVDAQRDMLRLHCDATITLCRAAVPYMAELGGGVIINVSSLAALAPGKGFAVYGATKAFLNYFSASLQEEVRPDGIEVQALCPGFTRTEFHDAMSQQGFDRERVPGDMWMDAGDVVAASLAALGSGQVLVVPGETNQALARAAVDGQQALFGSG